MYQGAAQLLDGLIDPKATRLRQLPEFVLVFGGPLGDPRKSARQLFINWLDLNKPDLREWIRTPEYFQDWNSLEGYANLIDFERDALCLTRAVVLFSESPGSHAELGAFCMDTTLSDRLLVVISDEHYKAGSFIAKGPIKKIEDIQEDSICTVRTINCPDIQAEMPHVAAALDIKIKSLPKTATFDPERRRDQFLLVADLIDLFGALTVTELVDLCELMELRLSVTQVKAIYSQLARFGIVTLVNRYGVKYYTPTSLRSNFLDYGAKQGSPAFDRIRFKTREALQWLNSDAKRHSAYEAARGEVK